MFELERFFSQWVSRDVIFLEGCCKNGFPYTGPFGRISGPSAGIGLIFFRISRDLRPNWAKCVGFPRRGAYFCVFAANCDGIRVLCGFRKGFIWVYTPFTVYFEVIFKGISTEISCFALPQIVVILIAFPERARYVIILHSIA